ncbi:hypothetical protein A5733_00425 [Mycobacterium sp. NS-7484]|uniref:hypothetical protein n=1 Tax=unclassified Mycobacterium TaxID=2642494 RepID=UPI0007FDDE21|nr:MULTISPECIES: hypothetical protein [unclassified Mycobacterium]OBG84702.1 hypothetical protein A5699_26210 [Mycobacterium sp. E802]OMC00114.1 hypothetical protein A5733_00425 [Mycobacterium sp. NS-7484]
MGKSLNQILEEVGDGSRVGITLVTNQDSGIASYATGEATYHPGSFVGPIFRPARLSTSGGEPLKYYFSDRTLDIDPPAGEGGFGHTPRQPFSANAVDKLGFSISLLLAPRVIKFTLHSWGNATFSVSMEERGTLLIGQGPAIGNQSEHALYVVGFTGVFHPPH